MTIRLGMSLVCLLLVRTSLADDPAKSADKSEAVESKSAANPQKGESKPVAPSDANLLRSLEKQAAPSQPDENPLERVDQRMRDVQGRLAKSDSGTDTQVIQKEIVDDLETLIDQVKKNGKCPQCGAANCTKHGNPKRQTSNKQQPGKPSKPNQGSEPKEGEVTAAPGSVSDEQKAANDRLVRAIWGHLPEKLREEMQQASQDTGLPKYRPLIELYFRAIAEQNASKRTATP
jgi:hypothetical protein